MNTLGKINRPIRFWGLSAGQFGLFMVINALIIIVFVFIDMYPVIIVTVMGAIFYVSSILFKNLKREHKAGNPNYLSSLSVYMVPATILFLQFQISASHIQTSYY